MTDATTHGFDTERTAAMSDGVFGVALTLLVVDLNAHPTELLERLFPFAASFFVIALYWVAHHNEFAMLTKLRDRWVLWLNLVFLFFIVLQPWAFVLATMAM